ncbi:MAG TPA: NAD(P)/FAD-dependent oxidoreductase [Candidatus Limnocylindria bacterium]|jgi:dihydrolipoamide dehydrogenase|nr:NAD(P)/FAD-dependent oxidoreductase [Candidatus Limnocylindria bacterium]
MDRYDLVVVGAGAAGESAAYEARELDARVAIVERDLFGGGCPYWQCMPSKALLHAAAVHHGGGDYPWDKASAFRDYMINRVDRDYPDDTSHFRALRKSGAEPIRGEARFTGTNPLRLEIREQDGSVREVEAGSVVLAVGSHSRIPSLPGLDASGHWTNREGTSLRELPDGVVVLGGGPSGVELSQVYARYGVPVTLVHPHDRINDRDHPRSSKILAEALRRDGVELRFNARATGVRAGAGTNGRHLVELSDGTTAEGAALLMTIGRDVPFDRLNLGAVELEADGGRLKVDDELRAAPDIYLAGDAAGPELHTHMAHYQGEIAARNALGAHVKPDLRAIPRATYTDPETSSTGLLLEQAQERGIDAKEYFIDLAKTARGETVEAAGHVTIVVDRGAKTLVGAFLAGPGVSETVHEAVLAVKLQTPLSVLADTIHAFPTVARAMGSLFIEAHKELG